MPTTNKTASSSTQTNAYDPGSMQRFQQFGQSGGNVLQQDMQDPLSQIGFNQRLQMGNQNSFNLFNRNNSNIANRASSFGGAQMPGFLQNQMNQNGMGLAASQSNNFNSNLLYADQLRQSAASQALSYRPLQTGGSMQGQQTQSTGGVGAWAGPLISAGLGVATGGMSTMAGGMGGMLGQGGAQAMGFQGSNPMMFSGQGDQSAIQPSMFSDPSQLQAPSYNPYLGVS